jgi:hypothetical protein
MQTISSSNSSSRASGRYTACSTACHPSILIHIFGDSRFKLHASLLIFARRAAAIFARPALLPYLHVAPQSTMLKCMLTFPFHFTTVMSSTVMSSTASKGFIIGLWPVLCLLFDLLHPISLLVVGMDSEYTWWLMKKCTLFCLSLQQLALQGRFIRCWKRKRSSKGAGCYGTGRMLPPSLAPPLRCWSCTCTSLLPIWNLRRCRRNTGMGSTKGSSNHCRNRWRDNCRNRCTQCSLSVRSKKF